MKATTQMIFDKMETMIEMMNNMDEKFTMKIENVNTKMNELQDQIQSIVAMTAAGGGGQGPGGNISFMKIENKEEYLNQYKPCCGFEGGFHNFIFQRSIEKHTDNEMMNVLYNNISLMEYIVEVIAYIYSEQCEQNMKFLHVFEFQKNIIYFWNEKDGKGWEKASVDKLKSLFDIVQKSLVAHYTQFLKTKRESSNNNIEQLMDIMEKSSAIYVDDFQKQVRNFKKLLFDKLCELNH